MRIPENESRRSFIVSTLTLTLFVAMLVPLVSFPEGSAITWNPIEEISEDKRIEYQRYPAIAADGGRAYAVWADNGDRDYDILVREHDGTAWQLEEEVNTDDRDIDQFLPDVAADNGVVHVVWHDPTNGDYDILYRRNSGGAWGPLEEVSADMASEIQQNPAVAAADGKVYVVWQDGRDGDWDIYFRYHDGAAWSTVQEVSADSGTEAQNSPSISAGGGKAYVVWEDTGGGDNDIMMRVFDGSSWGSVIEVSEDSSNEAQSVPDVAYDAGKVHVVWEEFRTTDRDIFYRSWDGSSFSTVQEISVDGGTEFQNVPSVAAEFGKVHVVWADRGDGDWDIVYRQYDGVSWLSPQEISVDSATENQWIPDVASDGGMVHVVWEDQGDGDNDIFYRRGYESPGVDTSPPDILDVRLDGSTIQIYPLSLLPPSLTLTATVDDSSRGGSIIGGANYTSPSQNWVNSTFMIPDDLLDTPTEGFHATVDTSSLGIGSYDICAYGWDEVPNNNIAGSCATLVVNPSGVTDEDPPEIHQVFIDGVSAQTFQFSSLPASFTLTALIDDSQTGNSAILGANYTVGPGNWPGTPMSPSDALWDEASENVEAIVTTPSQVGTYIYCVYASDQAGNHNTTGECATLTIEDDLPPGVLNVLVDLQSSVTVLPGTVVTLTATLDDSRTGKSGIQGANYTVGAANWPGTSMNPSDGSYGEMVEDVDVQVSTAGWSVETYWLCVYGWDDVPNHNLAGSCARVIVSNDIEPPIVSNVELNGEATLTLNLSELDGIFLTANVDDSLTGNSNISDADYFWGPPTWPGTLMQPSDGQYDSPVEDVSASVTASDEPGTYEIWVRGCDEYYNCNYSSATLILVDDMPPAVLDVMLDGEITRTIPAGTSIVTLSAKIDDTFTGGAVVGGANFTSPSGAWWNSTTMTSSNPPLDNSIELFTATLETHTLGPGTYGIWVYGWDSYGNFNAAPSTHAVLVVTGETPVDRPPIIESVSVEPSRANEGEEVEVIVVATDDGRVDEVWIEVLGPDGEVLDNVSAEYDDSVGGYVAVLTYYNSGEYTITTWVGDDGGNWASEEEGFEVLESVSVPQQNYKPVLAVLFTILLLIIGFIALRTNGDRSKVKRFWFLPFALAEAATCVISTVSGSLSIPPVLGPGLIVDMVILLLGLSLPVLYLLRKPSPLNEESGILVNEPESSNDPENTK